MVTLNLPTCIQVLTVNQVVEILLKFLETRDWKDSFFQVIPQRKRCEAGSKENDKNDESIGINEEEDEKMSGQEEADDEDGEIEDDEKIERAEGEACLEIDDQKTKRQCIETQI